MYVMQKKNQKKPKMSQVCYCGICNCNLAPCFNLSGAACLPFCATASLVLPPASHFFFRLPLQREQCWLQSFSTVAWGVGGTGNGLRFSSFGAATAFHIAASKELLCGSRVLQSGMGKGTTLLQSLPRLPCTAASAKGLKSSFMWEESLISWGNQMS